MTPDVQQRLLEGYREQLRLYDQAAAIIDQTNTQTDWANGLNDLLAEIARLDAAMADDKVAWRRFGPRPGEVSELIEQIARGSLPCPKASTGM